MPGLAHLPWRGRRPAPDTAPPATPAQGPAAHAVLEDLGFVEGPRSEAWRSHWTPRDSGTIRSLALAHADNPWSLDLHVSLDRRVFRGLTTTLDTPEPVTRQRWHEVSRPVHVRPHPLLLPYRA